MDPKGNGTKLMGPEWDGESGVEQHWGLWDPPDPFELRAPLPQWVGGPGLGLGGKGAEIGKEGKEWKEMGRKGGNGKKWTGGGTAMGGTGRKRPEREWVEMGKKEKRAEMGREGRNGQREEEAEMGKKEKNGKKQKKWAKRSRNCQNGRELDWAEDVKRNGITLREMVRNSGTEWEEWNTRERAARNRQKWAEMGRNNEQKWGEIVGSKV